MHTNLKRTKKTVCLFGHGFLDDKWSAIEKKLLASGFSIETFPNEASLANVPDFFFGIAINAQFKICGNVRGKSKKGIFVFHSSDLPKGKGWAPIFWTIMEGKDLIISMIKAVEKIDEGPLICRGKLPLHGWETEKEVRSLDKALTIIMLEHFLVKIFQNKEVTVGIKQEGKGSWKSRRSPSDSEITFNENAEYLSRFLRAIPDSAPAFTKINGRKFLILVKEAGPEHWVNLSLEERIKSSEIEFFTATNEKTHDQT